jgi:hypothetical protein
MNMNVYYALDTIQKAVNVAGLSVGSITPLNASRTPSNRNGNGQPAKEGMSPVVAFY